MLHEDKKYESLDRERLDYLDKEVSNYLEDLIDCPERHEMLTESDEVAHQGNRNRSVKKEMQIVNEENFYSLQKINELEMLVVNMKEEKE
jgi:hypothetical protein